MKIGIDVDNVLNNLTECAIKIYNEDSGDNLSLEDITSYGLEGFVLPQYKDRIKNYFEDSKVWKQIKVTKGAREFIGKLFKDGHEIYFCTKTTPRNVPKKFSWLQRNFPFLDIGKCTFLGPEKGMIKFDYLVDDAPENILHKDREYVSLIMDCPWNRDVKDDGITPIIRCHNWEEIYNSITNCAAAPLPQDICLLCKCNDCNENMLMNSAAECGNCNGCSEKQNNFKEDCHYYR